MSAGESAYSICWKFFLCDAKIRERLIPKICRAITRLTATYGLKCWPMINKNETVASVVGKKILECCLEMTVRRVMKVVAIKNKLLEKRVGWFAHVVRKGNKATSS